MRLVFGLVLILGFSACGGAGGESAADVTEGVDVEKDPLGAIGALAKAGQDLEKLQQELATLPRAEVVHFSVLLKALPDPPSGWTADEPRGSTNQMGDYKMSEVNRRYRKEDGQNRVDIQIQDWAFNQALYIPFFMQARFSQESTEGYSKGIKIGDALGREEYTNSSRSGQRMVLVNKRFQIQIRINNMEPEAFNEWWPRVKVSELPATGKMK